MTRSSNTPINQSNDSKVKKLVSGLLSTTDTKKFSRSLTDLQRTPEFTSSKTLVLPAASVDADFIEYLVEHLPTGTRKIVISDKNFTNKAGRKLLQKIDNVLSHNRSVKVDFVNCVVDREAKRFVHEYMTNRTTGVDNDSIPEMDMDFLVQGIIEKGLMDENSLFLQELSRNGDIDAATYNLLKKKDVSDQHAFNKALLYAIASMSSTERAQIQKLSRQIRNVIESIPDLDTKVKDMRLQADDLIEFQRLNDNRAAHTTVVSNIRALSTELAEFTNKLQSAKVKENYLLDTPFGDLFVEQLTEKVEDVERLLETIRASQDTENSNIGEMQGQIAEFEEKNNELKAIDINAFVKDAIDTEVQDKTEKRNELQALVEKKTDEKNIAQGKVDHLRKVGAGIPLKERTQREANNTSIRNLNTAINTLSTEINDASRKVSALDAEIKAAKNSKVARTKAKKDEIDKFTKANDHQIGLLNSQKEIHEKDLEKLKKEEETYANVLLMTSQVIDAIQQSTEENDMPNVRVLVEKYIKDAKFPSGDEHVRQELMLESNGENAGNGVFEKLVKEIQWLKDNKQQNKAAVETIGTEIQGFNDQIAEHQTQITDLETEGNEYQQIADILEQADKANLATAKGALTRLKSKLKKVPPSFVEEIRNTVTAENLDGLVTRIDGIVETKVTAIEEKKTRIGELETKITEANGRIETLHQEDTLRAGPIAKEFQDKIDTIEGDIRIENNKKDVLDANYDAAKHTSLTNDFNDDANDMANKVGIIAEAIQAKLAAGDPALIDAMEDMGNIIQEMDTSAIAKLDQHNHQ